MEHLESLFSRALDAVVGMDDAGRVIAWNRAAEEIFGHAREDALGRMMGDLIVPPQYRDAHAKGLAHYNRTGEGPVLEQRIKIEAMDASGNEIPVELSIFPMPREAGGTVFYAFIRSRLADEIHRREQELRAREAEVLLDAAQRLLGEQSFEDFTRDCLVQVCDLAGLEAGHLFLSRTEGDAAVLLPTNIWHISEAKFSGVAEATAASRFRIGEGLPGRAWQAREIVVVDDLSADDKFARRDAFAAVGLTRGLALPVMRGGTLHAVLEFYGTDAARLDAEIVRLVRTVGSQIGLAIQTKEDAERREMLRREIAHRVGNSLAILGAIFRGCARRAGSVEELSADFLTRLSAMGQASRHSVVEADDGVALGTLIREAIGVLPTADSVPLDIPKVTVESAAVMPLSLILNELATNALKYGDITANGSALTITARRLGADGLELEWSERRATPLEDDRIRPERPGFGSTLIRTMAEKRLGGLFTRRIDARGCLVELKLPGVVQCPPGASG